MDLPSSTHHRQQEDMVNFSKHFEGQLVPEWKDAYIDYRQLKKDLKRMKILASSHEPKEQKKPPLLKRVFSPRRKLPVFTSHGRRDHEAIQVHRKLASSASKGEDFYETELLEQFADTDAAKEFFARLDLQLNKVNKFYKGKEAELLERGESLQKQMEVLTELGATLKKQLGRGRSSNHELSEDTSVSSSIACEEESVKGRIDPEQPLVRPTSQSERGEIQLDREQPLVRPTCESEKGEIQLDPEQPLVRPTSQSEKGEIQLDPEQPLVRPTCESERGEIQLDPEQPLVRPTCESERGEIQLDPEQPLVRPTCESEKGEIQLDPEQPLVRPTSESERGEIQFSGSQYQSKKCGPESSGKLNINRTKVHHAEKMIRGAYIELYKGLGYLKTYRNLNLLAFVKILKKFDMVTGKQVLHTYLKVVESSYFNSSDKVIKLMDVVEELFIKHFAQDDKRKAMKYLKPHQRTKSHGVTFFIGLFTGCFIALFTGYCIMAHLAGMYTGHSDSIYMEIVYPVFSMFSLLFLQLFLYGCNIFLWRKTRINYRFIFELAPTKELKYQDVFLICTTSMTLVVGVLFVLLSLIAQGYSSKVQAIPGILLIFLILLVCPFNVVYRSSRYHFLKIIRKIILSPFYKVVMVDFFMADQLCSQVPMLRNLEYVACYYVTGSYKVQDYGLCSRSTHYRNLAYAVSFLPYYWRVMQCARRWFDEGETSHLINMGKFVSAMLAAGAKVAYEKEKTAGWLFLLAIVSSGATMYQLYWDFVKDWGLLQFNSRDRWLRNDLVLRRKYIYFLSMGLNFVLRLAWLQTVLHYNFGSLDYKVTTFFIAALEVIRRGQWNFYRLENEHINNAGKFRAVKTVPLPFHEVDQD